MASATDLQFGPLQKAQLGLTSKAVTAAGSSTTDATVLNSQITFVILTATGSDGIRLASDTPLLTPIWISNPGGSAGILYPPTGGTINGGASETVGATTVAIAIRYSATAWACLLGA